MMTDNWGWDDTFEELLAEEGREVVELEGLTIFDPEERRRPPADEFDPEPSEELIAALAIAAEGLECWRDTTDELMAFGGERYGWGINS